MRYPQLKYVPEKEDPSVTVETAELVAKIIDNTGLTLPRNEARASFFGAYRFNDMMPISHHLGYHGIRTLYNKGEKRNLVLACASWLNLQAVSLEGIENDPVDERAWAGVARGWPVRMERRGAGALLTIEPLPRTQFAYAVEFQPAEPDGIDFSIRFTFRRHPDSGPARARFSWPCYMHAYEDVRFFYPRSAPSGTVEWVGLGERPDIILGEPVGYVHQQTAYHAEDQAMPLGFGRIGEYALAIMLSDPKVRFFVVNSGGHQSWSPVQNPAWDFQYEFEDYPLNRPVGFEGRLVYSRFAGQAAILRRYEQWVASTRGSLSAEKG